MALVPGRKRKHGGGKRDSAADVAAGDDKSAPANEKAVSAGDDESADSETAESSSEE
jgi:hypothetical protein